MIEPFQYQPSKLSRKSTLQPQPSPINPSFRKVPDQDPWTDYVPDEFLLQNSENLDPTTMSSFSQSQNPRGQTPALSTVDLNKSQTNNASNHGSSKNRGDSLKQGSTNLVQMPKSTKNRGESLKIMGESSESSLKFGGDSSKNGDYSRNGGQSRNGVDLNLSKASLPKPSNPQVSLQQPLMMQQQQMVQPNGKPISFQKAYKTLAHQMLDRQLNESSNPAPSNLIEGLLLGPGQIEALESHCEKAERARIDAFSQKLEVQAQKAQQKREALVQEVMNHQFRDCTFTPNGQQQQGESTTNRSFSEFLHGQQQFQSRLEAKKQALKEAEERRVDAMKSNGPKINPKSKRMAELKSPVNQNKPAVFDRLYSHSTRSHSSTNFARDNSQFFPDQDPKFFNGLAEVPEVESGMGGTQPQSRAFVPEINQKSKELNRNEPIDQILYKDAQRRQQSATNRKPSGLPSQQNVSQSLRNPISDRLLIQRFIKDFEAAVTGVTKDPTKDLGDFMDYLSLNSVLQILGFVSEGYNPNAAGSIQGVQAQERALISELWTILNGDAFGGVSKRNLCVFLLAVLGLYWAESNGCQSNNRSNQDNQSLGRFNEKNEWEIDESECRAIHVSFELFYRTRLASESLRKTRRGAQGESSTFQPEISETSKVLAEHYRERLLEEFANILNTQTVPELKVPENGALTHTDLLVLQKKTQVMQHERKKQERKVEELKDCPFKPNINAKRPQTNSKKPQSKPRFLELYDLSKNRREKKDRDPEEIEFERNAEHCTFKPEIMPNNNTSKKLSISKSPEYFARDVEKTVERMRNARKERDFIKLWTERGVVLGNGKPSAEDPAADNIEKFRAISSSSRITRPEDEEEKQNGNGAGEEHENQIDIGS